MKISGIQAVGKNSIEALAQRVYFRLPQKTIISSIRKPEGDVVFIRDKKTKQCIGTFTRSNEGKDVTRVYRNNPDTYTSRRVYIDEGKKVSLIEYSDEGTRSAGTYKINTYTMDASKGRRRAVFTHEIEAYRAFYKDGVLRQTKMEDFQYKATKYPHWYKLVPPSLEDMKTDFFNPYRQLKVSRTPLSQILYHTHRPNP